VLPREQSHVISTIPLSTLANALSAAQQSTSGPKRGETSLKLITFMRILLNKYLLKIYLI
jgi:hypothetical protein